MFLKLYQNSKVNKVAEYALKVRIALVFLCKILAHVLKLSQKSWLDIDGFSVPIEQMKYIS